MTRQQHLERTKEHLDSLNNEALTGLLPHLGATRSSVDDESALWLTSDLEAALPYLWQDVEPETLGVPLSFVEGKGWVFK